jgi:hypothetical protein
MVTVRRYRLRPRLAAAAAEFVAAGWPVAPGSWWDPHDGRYRCAEPDCVTESLHPTLPDFASQLARRCQIGVTRAATRDPDTVNDRWGSHPYSVLLPTGHVADAIELGPVLARRALAVLAAYEQLGPAAVYPNRRVLLFTTVARALDAPLTAELTRAGALHHSTGSWVPLPPTTLASGEVTWARTPEAARWRLPSPRHVADALRLAAMSSRR